MLVPNEDFLNLREVHSTAAPPLFSISAEDAQMKTQVETLTQDWLIDRALKRQKGAHTPVLTPPKGAEALTQASMDLEAVQTVRENLRVEPSHRSRIVRIVYESRDPKDSAEVVNALAQTFIEQRMEARSSAIQETRVLLERQLSDLKTMLSKSEGELNKFASSAGILLTEGQEHLSADKLRLLQEELSKAEADRITRESLVAAQPSGRSDAVVENEVVRQYRVDLTELRRQLADLGTILTPESKRVKQLKAQIEEIENAIDREVDKGHARLKEEYDAARWRESALSRSVVSQSERLASHSSKMIRYNLLKDDLERTERFYDTIAQKVNEAAIASAIRPSDVRLLTPAQPPLRPYRPSMPLYASFGMMAGLCVGLGYVAVKERGVRRLRMPGDSEDCLGVPELGAIPSARHLGAGVKSLTGGKASGVERISFEHKGSDLSESFRGALIPILSAARSGQPPRSILVTSALPVEGKTTVVSNIGIALSQAQKRVVLIDGDLRRPRLHEIFRTDNTRGLSTFLADRTPTKDVRLDELVRPTSVTNLHLLSSGPVRNNPSQLLYSLRMDELIQRLREEFDHVLIDTPPCLKFADARIMALHVDGVLLVLRANYTYDKSAIAAANCFLADGVPVLGTILNDWNPRTSPAYGFDRYAEHYGNGIKAN
jgi:capsular exopolysaccharide synthesis family protein